MSLPAADPTLVEEYTQHGWWGPETVSQHVRRWADSQPDAVAYGWGDARLTWHEYDVLIDAIAQRLAGFDLARGTRVLVLLPDGGALHAAFVACERAGLIAVGVGWRAGEAELAHLTRQTDARAAIAARQTRDAEAAAVLDRLDIHRRVFLDLLDTTPAVEPGPFDAVTIAPIEASELWLLNSTSGTTGLPKCVMQTQNRWVYFHQLAVDVGQLTERETWMSVVPAPFGFGLWTSHVSPTLQGATCFVQRRFDPLDALRTIERERVTVLCAVSSQFVMMLNEHSDEDLSSLKVMYTGGEAISTNRAVEFEERTGCTILNFYGSNETGLLSGTRVSDPPARRLSTGGRCDPNMSVRLYDEMGNRLPSDRGRGQPACRGPALSLGYWDDPAANAELYTDDGWMRMGDIVEIDEDDFLTVVGRTSDFIIRGGKNISAPAVEAEVATHPAIALCAAVAFPDARLGERVGIFAEVRDEITLDALTSHLADRGVSKEWWPEHLVVLDALPMSSGGKVAKSALRDRARGMVDQPPAS